MISRRSFLGYSAAAMSVPLWAHALGTPSAFAAAPETLKFNLVNNSGATAYAYIVGSHGEMSDGRAVFIKADGTPFFPARPGGGAEPITEDIAIPVNGSTEVIVPRMFGARIYFVTEEKLEFLAVQGDGDKAAIAHPDFVSDSDPNFGKNWTFAEFTLDPAQIYANISYVDFVAAPIGLKLDHAGGMQEVPGLAGGAVDAIAASLREADGGKWATCVQESGVERGPEGKESATEPNPRNNNKHGQVLELEERGGDPLALAFSWRLLLVCGDPAAPDTYFAGFPKDQVSPISSPDNVAFDPHGNLWISTDSAGALGINDGLYVVPLEGRERGHLKLFLTVPKGAETCGPVIEDRLVTVCVQHPGEVDDADADNPVSHWPDGGDTQPRPSVVAVWKPGRHGPGPIG